MPHMLVLIIALSLVIISIVFYITGFFMFRSTRLTKQSSVSTFGTLVGFRRYYTTDQWGDNSEDYTENKPGRVPIVSFYHNGEYEYSNNFNDYRNTCLLLHAEDIVRTKELKSLLCQYNSSVLKFVATAWLKSLHIGGKRARASVISSIIDYIRDPQKTDGGRLITSYGCDNRIADKQFMLAKREYELNTGRSQGKRDVIAYHIRQSFKPGEVDTKTANRIGYELAVSFTKGSHAFVVATHIWTTALHSRLCQGDGRTTS